jgi:hypothetical protein
VSQFANQCGQISAFEPKKKKDELTRILGFSLDIADWRAQFDSVRPVDRHSGASSLN